MNYKTRLERVEPLISPIEVRKIVVLPRGKGELAFYISIPKEWYKQMGEPEEVGVVYSEEPSVADKFLFVSAELTTATEKIQLKTIDRSKFIPIRESFIKNCSFPLNVVLQKHDVFVEILIPERNLHRNELTYKMKMRKLNKHLYKTSLSKII